MSIPLRILLVEDNDDDAALLLAMLRQAGYEPEYAIVQTAGEMREALPRQPWDIIISDFSLPAFNAPSALQILRESGLDIPAIVISGTIGEEVAVETLKLGASDYLLKQNLTRLAAAIERTLLDTRNRRERQTVEHINKLIMANSLDAIFVIDRDARVISASTAAGEMWGRPAADLAGRSILEQIHHEDVPIAEARFHSVIQGNPARDFECRLVRDDQTVIPLLCSAYWSEKDALIFATAKDITERKQQELALRRSESSLRRERALLKSLIDSIPDLIFFKDRNSVFLGCNKAFEEYIGIPEEELVGRTDFHLVSEESARFFRDRDNALFTTERALLTEEVLRSHEGLARTFETLKTPYFGPDQELLGLIGISRDISERRQAEEQIRRMLDRLQIAARASKAGVWEIDLISGEVSWDDQMFALYGETPSELKDGVERWFRHMRPEDISHYRTVIEDAAHSRSGSFSLEYPITRSDDRSERLIQSQAIIGHDGDGRPVRIVGINRDVTEERNRERSLSHALAQEKELAGKARAGERAKSEFLAVMSHELRTPMNGILGFAELLVHSSSLPADCRNYAQTIMQSGEALLRILDDILDFSRLEAGRLQIETQSFSPHKMIGEIQTLLLRQAREKNLSFNTKVDEGIPPFLEGDAGRIRQILVNLIGNALKFTEHGSVNIDLSRGSPLSDGRCLYDFRVWDTGSGIPAEKLDSIFQPFTQADSSISRRHGGTGLGLTISRRLTELLGGTLSVHSSPGVGSEFLLSIPLAVPGHSPDLHASPESFSLTESFASTHPLRILLVEDDKVNLKLIQTLIRRLGYEPLSAKNGREAVEIFEQEWPDCTLMDLQMPEMDGIEATGRIRSLEHDGNRDGHCFISALTANIFPADRQRCLSCGMNSYLNKPVKITALAEVLAQADRLRRRRSPTA